MPRRASQEARGRDRSASEPGLAARTPATSSGAKDYRVGCAPDYRVIARCSQHAASEGRITECAGKTDGHVVRRFAHSISFDIGFSQNQNDLRQKMAFILETNMDNCLRARHLAVTNRHGFQGSCIETESRRVSGDDHGAKGLCHE